MASHDLKALVEANPYTGTAQQVCTLCLGIYEASVALDAKTMRAARDQIPITDKIFSKLKVVGKVLDALTPDQRTQVIKCLPDSYSTIHALCSLKPQELHTATKSKRITRTTSIRAARELVKQIRFPALAGDPTLTKGTKKKAQGDPTWRTVISLHEDPSRPLTDEDLLLLHAGIRQVAQEFGVEVRAHQDTSITSLQRRERAEKETFWRSVLESELPEDWFDGVPKDLRKQFNLKKRDELTTTPLRQFTGLIMKWCQHAVKDSSYMDSSFDPEVIERIILNKRQGEKRDDWKDTEGKHTGRNLFWARFGRAYIAKLHLEQAVTDDRTQRHNYKRRLEEVFADDLKGGRDLAVWNNQMLKGAGLPID